MLWSNPCITSFIASYCVVIWWYDAKIANYIYNKVTHIAMYVFQKVLIEHQMGQWS